MSKHQEEPLETEAIAVEGVDPGDVAERLDEDREGQANLTDRDPGAEQEFRDKGPDALPTPEGTDTPRP